MHTFNLVAGMASIAGLVFSVLAFRQAKKASQAAAEARDAVHFKNLVDEIEMACARAEQLVDLLRHDRLDEAVLRVGELTSALSEMPRRRAPISQRVIGIHS